MTKLELIQTCKDKIDSCLSKSDFKKKYNYWYKLACKENLIDILFPNYDTNDVRYLKLSKKYSLDYLLNKCKDCTKSEFKNSKIYYKLLTEFYKIDINKIEFRNRRRVDFKYSEEYLINITNNIKYKFDFLYKYPNEYKYCKYKGYFKTILAHLIPFNISAPQLILYHLLNKILNKDGILNDRTYIKPYEIDIFYPDLNLGFEYNGKFWHKNNKNDIIKNKICDKKELKLITIEERAVDLKLYEKHLKEDLINLIDVLKNYVKYDLSIEYINNITIDYHNIITHNIDKYKETALLYKTRSEFEKKDYAIYNNCLKLKILDIVAPHLKPVKRWNKKSALEEAKRYNTIKELNIKNSGCYQYLLKHKLIDETNIVKKKIYYKSIDMNVIKNNYDSINTLRLKNHRLYGFLVKNSLLESTGLKLYTDDYVIKILKKYESFKKFRRDLRTFFNIIYTKNQQKKLIDNYFISIDFNRHFDLDFNEQEIANLCKKYEKIKNFKRDYNRIYKFILKNKLIDKYFPHVETLKFRHKF